jgi:hypothetical protein
MLLRFGAKKATIADIDFNPMAGNLSVFDLQIQGPDDDRITMERLIVAEASAGSYQAKGCCR